MPDKPPPGSVVSPWDRILWRLQAAQPSSGMPSAYDYWADLFTVPEVLEDPEATQWRRFQMNITDATSTELADDLHPSIDIVNYTNGSADNTWTDADYVNVRDRLIIFWTAVMPLMNTRYHYQGFNAYVMQFLPVPTSGPDDKPFADAGAPERTETTDIPGGSAGTIPPQPACTITEVTASRPHWGRWYLPCPAGTALSGSGRLTSVAVDAIADAAQQLYEDLFGQQLLPVVPSTRSGGNPIRALQTVNAIRVDDVVDVVRRRRHKYKSYFADRGEITPVGIDIPG